MRPGRRRGSLVAMHVEQRSLSGELVAAHAVLWVQAALSGLAWLLPVAGVVLWAAVHGVPDDGTAAYLLIPVVFAVPPLLFAVPGLALAAMFPAGRGGVRAGVVVYEALWVIAGAAAFAGLRVPFGLPLPVRLVLLAAIAAAAFVLAVLLTPAARAHFR